MISAKIQKGDISFEYGIFNESGEKMAKGVSKVVGYDSNNKTLFVDAFFYNVTIETKLQPYEITTNGWHFY